MLTLLCHQRGRNTEQGREKKPAHKCRVCNLKQFYATLIGSLVMSRSAVRVRSSALQSA